MARRLAKAALCGVMVLMGTLGVDAQAPQAPLAPRPVPRAGPPVPAGDAATAAEAHFELGEMYHGQVFQALDQATKAYEEAIRLRPDHGRAHYNLGLAYHTKAKLGSDDKELYRKALRQYQLYLRYNPDGDLAAKAKQNIAAVEAQLGEERPAKGAKQPRPPAKGSGGQR